MSFVYEVNLEVKPHRTKEFHDWLIPHIEEMLTFRGFLEATWYTRNRQDEGIQTEVTLWTVHYTLSTPADYQHYLETHAARMRAEGISAFGDDFRASRRLLHSHKAFTR